MAEVEPTRRAHLAAVEALEAQVIPVVLGLMRKAMAAAVARLNLGAITAAGEGFTSLDDLQVIESTWAAGVRAQLIPAIQSMYEAGALAAMIEHGDATTARQARRALAPIEQVVDRRAVEYLRTATNRLDDVGARLWSTARRSLSEGFAAGEPMTDIADRMASVLRVGEVRAMTIARTEVIGAANAGALEGERAIGRATHKQWLATLGERTRDSHAEADGQVVPIGEQFSVGDDMLDHPGDPSGSPEEVVNCRCTMLFVDDPDGVTDMDGRESPIDIIEDEEALVAASTPTLTAAFGLERLADGGFRLAMPEGMDPLTIGVDHPDHATWAMVADDLDVPANGDGLAAQVAQQGEQFHAVMVVEGIETGDGRLFDSQSLTWVEPPFALGWQRETDHNSVPAGALQVGLVTRVERRGDAIHGWGHFDMNGEVGAEAARQVREGFLRWGSIDPDDIAEADVELRYPEGVPADEEPFVQPSLAIFHAGRLRGFTLCSISALVEATVEWVGEGSTGEGLTGDQVAQAPVEEAPVVAAAVEELGEGDRVRWNLAGEDRTGSVVSVDIEGQTVTVAPDDGSDPVTIPVAEVDRIEEDDEDQEGEEVDGAPVEVQQATTAAAGDPLPDDPAQAPEDGVERGEDQAPLDEPTHAGLAVVALDTGRVLLLQRALDEEDPASGRWEFPGGSIEEGEGAEEAARREFAEEVGAEAAGETVDAWDSPNGVYRGFVVLVDTEAAIDCNLDPEDRTVLNPDDPDGDGIEVCAWWTIDQLPDMPALREEVRATPWDLLQVAAEEKVEAAIVAAAHLVTIPDLPPEEWFDPPAESDVLGAVTITDEGRVYGYLAPANTPHLSPQFRGRTAPTRVSFDRFHRNETIVAGGHRVVTGALTMGCGHASTARSMTSALTVDHYDNTCSLFARVRCGLDRKGNTWVAGALFPDVSPSQVARAMACAASGDWRPGRGGTELVAGLMVPVPGFAMARRAPSVRYVDGAMVASAVPVRFEAAGARRASIAATAERIARTIGRDRAARAATLAARVHSEV